MLPRGFPRTVEFPHQRPVERLVYERGLPRPRDAGHDCQDAYGDVDIDLLEVVLPTACKAYEPIALPALCGNLDPEVAGKIAPGERVGVSRYGIGRPFRDDLAAVKPGPRSHIHDPVGAPDRLFVVLHHDKGVPEIAEALQCLEELSVVALVQPYGGLIEDVEHPGQVRSDLRSEAYSLRLPAREAAGAPREGQVADADLLQELKPCDDLL